MTEAEQVLGLARVLIENGKFQRARKLLSTLVGAQQPEALYMAAHFSACEDESTQQFEQRHKQQLQIAADGGYAPALYLMGVYHEVGDYYQRDLLKAAQLFRQAANAGHPEAWLDHGINMFYGSNGITENAIAGLAMIHLAADAGVDRATDFLRHFS
ncbi:hypothetical protein [Undibacterium sp. TJN19]|uniref:hypothetical protein n=1 Tax=Undibacterium sp. TJN19 TaxID=3413055 RepID=UPI003BF12475